MDIPTPPTVILDRPRGGGEEEEGEEEEGREEDEEYTVEISAPLAPPPNQNTALLMGSEVTDQPEGIYERKEWGKEY